ncbi:MAG: hypothetical protein U9P38_05055 [Campylobacterota bacterium]|nr:hypothetical protein [Campylobacterota bacterium]
MNDLNILQELENASLFDLYRVSAIVDNELENKHRLHRVRDSLSSGQTISWFDKSTHNILKAEVIKCHKDYCSVQNIEDKAVWDIEYSAINTNDLVMSKKQDKEIRDRKGKLEIGHLIMFIDRFNNSKYGVITKLNPKTVSVYVDDEDWQVSYEAITLHKDIDGNVIDSIQI